MASEKTVRAEIGHILVAIASKGYGSFLHPRSYGEKETPWRALGGSPVRSDSTAASAQSIAKLGPELD
jgi:hypothetical protein